MMKKYLVGAGLVAGIIVAFLLGLTAVGLAGYGFSNGRFPEATLAFSVALALLVGSVATAGSVVGRR